MNSNMPYPEMFKGKYVTRIGRKFGSEAFRVHDTEKGARQRCKYDNPVETEAVKAYYDPDLDEIVVNKNVRPKYASELWYANPKTGCWEEIEWWKS